MTHAQPSDITDMPVAEMPVPNRPRRWLNAAGIHTVGQIVERSEADLLTIENFGVTSLTHVKRFLHRHGLELSKPRQHPLDRETVRRGLRDRGVGLTPRERTILKLRHGIGARRGWTLQEVGRRYDLSRERVRQVQKQAEQKVIARLASRNGRERRTAHAAN